jgi:para-nitrobenzyl esterase
MTRSLDHVRLTGLSAAFAVASIALAACATAPSPAEGPVMTTAGLISGAPGKVPGVMAYKGIPFGAPPVGDLRWKPPQPVAPWQGVRDGSQFGDVCMQPVGQGRVNVSVDLPDSPPQSEDCLYLNVWTPAQNANAKLPVMVWIFGGAYYEGAGSSPHNNGDQLAAKGVVLVSFNYRLGPLGFLAHPELTAESPHHASGNYALADAIATLQWVQDNIAAFGGDPDNVTIFGESAGAAIAGGLVGSPEAAGLFHRAISESGAWMGLTMAPMRTRESAEAQTLQVASELGMGDLAALRAMPAQDASSKLPRQGMIIDGWIVPEDLSITFAENRQNAVDVIVGSNRDEGFFGGGFGPPMTLARWTESATQRWGDLAQQGLAAYPAANDAEAADASSSLMGDNMAWHMRLFAERQAAIGKQAWLYYFTHEPPYADGPRHRGSVHTVEIPYVFNNLAAPRVFPDASSPELASADPREVAFAGQVSQYWVNFARTGDPNGPGLPEWPAFTALGPAEAMVLDADGSGRGPSISQAQMDLYDALYERQMAASAQ